ncbi:MAG TPA: oligosaccharide flippase family protein [Anseongella sp.]|nr:oligosaccharide flippase family protein [Anseongella sp.]
MGIVRRQGFYNSVMIYAGMGMGYVNTILLLPRALEIEQAGYYTLFLSMSLMFAQLPASGITSLIAKFFPYFRSEDKTHKGFAEIAGLSAMAVFLLFTILYIAFRDLILGFYLEKSPRLDEYYYLVIPMAFFILWFSIFEVLSRAAYKTVFATFLREFLLKFGTAIGLLLVLFGYIGFESFLAFYIIIYGLICLFLLLQLIASGQFRLSWKMQVTREQGKEFLRYGFFTVLAGTPWVLIQKIDVGILGAYALPAVLGGYHVYTNMSAAISIPRNALNKVTYQIVSDAWEKQDLSKIDDIYRKTSIVQLMLGSLLFVGIIVNRDNLFSLMSNEDYFPYFSLFYFLGLGQLVDITGGLNAHIIAISPRYKTGTLLVFVACLLCIGLNLLIVPRYGGMGAAFVYFLTMLLYNLSTWWFLKKEYSLQPFSAKHIYILLFAGIALFAGWNVPYMGHVVPDILVRSLITALVFIVPALAFRISEDVNGQVQELIKKLGWKR